MFIVKDLRKIPTILDQAIDCNVYDANLSDDDDENDQSRCSNPRKKRSKRVEPLKALRLGRRKQEFECTVKVLCQPSYVPKLKYLESLNLYDCDIHDLEGFGTMFEKATPNLDTLNLGRNPLSKGIPDEFTKVRSLKHLWLDDCNLIGVFPNALLHLPNIESLRLPNNKITHLSIGGIDTNLTKKQRDGEEFEFDDDKQEASKVIPLRNLKLLCLDRNRLGESYEEKPEPKINKPEEDDALSMNVVLPPSSADPEDTAMDTAMDIGTTDGPNDGDGSDQHTPTLLPSNLTEWAPNLEELFLRHNGFSELGIRKWPSTMKVIQVSSNRLTNLDELVGDRTSRALTHIYANGNRLERLPEGILTDHPNLQRLLVSHNPPLCEMPPEVWQKLEEESDDEKGSCRILWKPNPNLRAPGTEGEPSDDEAQKSNRHVC